MLLEVLLIIFVIYLIYNYCFGGSKNGHSKSRLWTMYGNTSFEAIADKFTSVEDVTEAIRKCGLESSNLIFGRDLSFYWQTLCFFRSFITQCPLVIRF